MKQIKSNIEIPIWEKNNLTLKEAAEYFNIGITKLREICDKTKDYVLVNGTRILIKRKRFEEYLDKLNMI